jgi:hypothetical protein
LRHSPFDPSTRIHPLDLLRIDNLHSQPETVIERAAHPQIGAGKRCQVDSSPPEQLFLTLQDSGAERPPAAEIDEKAASPHADL